MEILEKSVRQRERKGKSDEKEVEREEWVDIT
jgi:hypothetical protein